MSKAFTHRRRIGMGSKVIPADVSAAQVLFTEAIEASSQKNYESAIKKFMELFEHCSRTGAPCWWSYHVACGNCHVRCQQYEPACEQFTKALKINQECVPALLGRGYYGNYLQKELEDATLDFRAARPLMTLSDLPKSSLAMIKFHIGEFKDAVRLLNEALLLRESSVSLWRRGLFFCCHGEFAKATKDFEKAYKKDPSLPFLEEECQNFARSAAILHRGLGGMGRSCAITKIRSIVRRATPMSGFLPGAEDLLSERPRHVARAILIAASPHGGDEGATARKGQVAGDLKGAAADMYAMQVLCYNLTIVIDDMFHSAVKPSKGRVLKAIEKLFRRTDSYNCLLYYTGHGERGTGRWCFRDRGRISYSEVLRLWIKHRCTEPDGSRSWQPRGRLFIISDSCFSGKWVDAAYRKAVRYGVVVQSAAGVDQCGWSSIKGGRFTRWWVCQVRDLASGMTFNDAIRRPLRTHRTRGIIETFPSIFRVRHEGGISETVEMSPMCTDKHGFAFRSKDNKTTSWLFTAGDRPIIRGPAEDQAMSATEELQAVPDDGVVTMKEVRFGLHLRVGTSLSSPKFNTDEFVLSVLADDSGDKKLVIEGPVGVLFEPDMFTKKLMTQKVAANDSFSSLSELGKLTITKQKRAVVFVREGTLAAAVQDCPGNVYPMSDLNESLRAGQLRLGCPVMVDAE